MPNHFSTAGMAYVEFSTEEEAKKAMLKTDGLMVGENKIEVAISNTPARKEAGAGGGDSGEGGAAGGGATVKTEGAATAAAATSESVAAAPHLGGGKKETLERGKARTQIALVPRAAMKPKTASTMMMPRSLKAKAPATSVAPKTAPAVKSEAMDVDKTSATGESSDSKAEGKKSNADFRNLLFK